MDLTSGDISGMIFRRSATTDIGDFSLDRRALNVYMLLNGKDTLEKLAESTGNNLGTMRIVISNLVKLGLIEGCRYAPRSHVALLGLIEEVRNDVVFLDGDFFRYLLNELSIATGPIAGVLIEDEVQSLGYEVDQFPGHRAGELVERLAAEIMRNERKAAFLKNMVGKIQQKGYPV